MPPAVDLESRAVLKACIGARAALAELQAASSLIPDASILVNTIPILEARASSEIENIVTSSDDLFRYVMDEAAATDSATKEALRYRAALWRGFELLKARPLSTNLAVEICTELRDVHTGVRKMPGAALRNAATRRAVYTPPEGEARLRELLANWEAFLHTDDDVDPLIKMAVGHYQFEAIHPFEDGNGRTGRILNLLYLVERRLLRHPVLYLSGAIIRTKGDYYRLLLHVSAKNEWVMASLHASRRRRDGALDHGQDSGDACAPGHCHAARADTRAQDLQSRAGGGHLRATVLSHRHSRERGHRQASDGF